MGGSDQPRERWERRRPRPTYANVTATLALFIALGGTSWAVIKLPRNSVGPAQLRPNAVSGTKIKNGSVNRSDLAPGRPHRDPRAAGSGRPARRARAVQRADRPAGR